MKKDAGEQPRQTDGAVNNCRILPGPPPYIHHRLARSRELAPPQAGQLAPEQGVYKLPPAKAGQELEAGSSTGWTAGPGTEAGSSKEWTADPWTGRTGASPLKRMYIVQVLVPGQGGQELLLRKEDIM